MPLFLYKSIDNAEIAVWQATEEIEFYKQFLAEHHFPTELVSGIKKTEKIRQWYASRYLLCQIFPGAIQYYNERKPILYNGPEISFSHSEDMVALILSTFKSGIDIQFTNPKLERIAPKFVNSSDLESVDIPDYGTKLCTIWSIKEAIFKYYITELPFKQIYIRNYNRNTGVAMVEVIRHGQHHMHTLSILNLGKFTMAYVLE